MMDPRSLLSASWAYRAAMAAFRGGKSQQIWVNRFIRPQPGQRVLDIGCGPANILAHLPADVEYYGFDHEPAYIASAKRRYGARGSFAVRSVAPDSVDGIGTFDLVLSIGVLHHLPDSEADILIASARKVLRPNGRLVTLDGVYVAEQNPIARLLLKLDRGRFVRTREHYRDLMCHHFETVEIAVLHNLLMVPYTHIIMEAKAPNIAEGQAGPFTAQGS